MPIVRCGRCAYCGFSSISWAILRQSSVSVRTRILSKSGVIASLVLKPNCAKRSTNSRSFTILSDFAVETLDDFRGNTGRPDKFKPTLDDQAGISLRYRGNIGELVESPGPAHCQHAELSGLRKLFDRRERYQEDLDTAAQRVLNSLRIYSIWYALDIDIRGLVDPLRESVAEPDGGAVGQLAWVRSGKLHKFAERLCRHIRMNSNGKRGAVDNVGDWSEVVVRIVRKRFEAETVGHEGIVEAEI